MDRNREGRRVAMATSNGLPRRRHRTSSLRDSPEDDGPLELQETARFRDRTGKRDRDREKERSERDRERDRLSRNKRRRGEKYIHGSNREDGVDESSDESINDEEEEDPEDGPVRFMPPNPVTVSSSSSPSSALTSNRKSYPPPSKVFRMVPTWKAADEMIGFSIPRKARSASTKRSHDWSSSGVAGEQFLRQTSSSPVRPSMAASSTAPSPSAAPMSPSSSGLSMKKKIKANGNKHRPPKSSRQSPSSIQDDIEIEVAEVLYGLMRQSQGPSKQEMMSNDSGMYDSREVNRSTGDSKSRASSPVSNSASIPAQDSSVMSQICNPSAPPLSAVAPKRKRPRIVSQLEENSASLASRSTPISATPKISPDLLAKQDLHSQNPEKNSDTIANNGGVSSDLVKSHGAELTREAVRTEAATAVSSSEEKRLLVADRADGKDTVMGGKLEEVPSPKKEPVDERVVFTSLQKITSMTAGEKENRREEKLEIDLMAPPPQSRSPERQGEMDNRLESMATYGEAEIKMKPSERVDAGRAVAGVNTDLNTEVVVKGSNSVAGVEEVETKKTNLNNKARNIDLHLDLDRSAALRGADDHKLNQQQQLQKQPPHPELKPSKDHTSTDKTDQPNSLPMSMPVPAGWPAGLPPMGYVAPMQPLQGMVSMDGRAMAPTTIQPPHFLFTQPRPGRCATHCYIAKNIYSHQQFMKNYPFWPAAAAAAGAAPLFGAKPYNLNLVPAAELHAGPPGRADVNPVQDKGQTFAFFPGQQPAVKDKSSQPATNAAVDVAQKKQLYQSLPPGGPSNMLHGPATLFFPMGQQQAAAAASSHGKSTKSPVPAGVPASASLPTSGLNASAATGQASPATMSFSYPNMPANDTQYLAILANGAYQFPVPTHVGAAQAYRGAHAQVMPFFSGSYYSQMIHPSQVQQQQQAPPSQPVQIQSSHQNPNISTASSSSQKHSQNQQQRPQGSTANGLTTNPGLQTFPIPKSRASQTHQLEMGGEGSPSTADSRVSRPPNMGVYGQNFALPFNPSNFAMMTSPGSLSGATIGGPTNGSHAEKKQQPHGQQQAMAPQAFAMSFASMNGATPPGLDLSSMEQNHAIFQSLPEAARNNYHIMAAAAAAQAAQQKKNYHGSEDGKSGGPGSSNADDERRGTTGKASALTGQSIAFSRSDMAETSVNTVSGNNVVDSSARSLNLVPGSSRSSRSSAPNAINNSTGSASQQQQQQQQQQQFIQLQKQQQFAVAAAQNKAPVTSNGSVYSDHLSASSAMTAKFPNALSGFPPSMVQGSSPAQSQWKNSGRTVTSQVNSPSMSTSNMPSMKNFGNQLNQARSQQGHTQISFGGNTKASTASQGQQVPIVTPSPSSPMMVGSPSTSSVSKGHSGSPRMTTSSPMGNKPAQASSLSAQQGKNSPSVPNQKSSPVTGSGRNVPSVFGNSHMPVSSSGGSSKPQLQPQSLQQLQQPQLSKQSIQQAQMFFSTAYMQTHPNTSSSATSAVGGFQLQRHRPDHQQQPMPKSQGGPNTTSSSSGMLSLSQAPANAGTNDPAKAVAAAVKGGILHAAQFAAQASGGAHTLVSAGFPYVHAVPAAAVQVKQAEQKQPAENHGLCPGNDNLPACWQPEKK